MQSSRKPGSHRRPSRRCRIRGRSKTRMRQNRRTRDSGRPEDPSPAPPEERALGATRRLTNGDAGRCQDRGDPGHIAGTARGCAIWGNLEEHRWHRRRARDSRQLGEPPAGGLRERRFGATRRFTRGKAGGSGSTGKPGARLGRRCRRKRIRGNPENRHPYRRRMRDSRKLGTPSPEKPEDRETGETRRTDRRRYRSSEGSGRPEVS